MMMMMLVDFVYYSDENVTYIALEIRSDWEESGKKMTFLLPLFFLRKMQFLFQFTAT